MKMKKRLLTLLAGLCACFMGATIFTACQNGQATTQTNQQESIGLEYTLNNDENSYILTGIGTCKDTKIVIPATYNDKNVTDIAGEAFKGCDNVTDVVIPDTIISIGDSAFEETRYYNKEENWDNGVLYIGKHLIKAKTSLSGSYRIKEGTICLASSAFYECSSLMEVAIPNSVVSISSGAFWGCKSLKNVVIPDSVVSIGSWAFHYCDSLTDIVIPDSVVSISSGAFWGCKSLKNVVIPDSVVSIGSWAFHYCDSLTDIVIPDSVVSLGGAVFDSCKNLTSVVIGDGATSIGGKAFYNCSNLKTVKIGNSVKTIETEAFAQCYNLTSLEIGSSVNFIGMEAFLYCNNLQDVYITDLAAWCNIQFRENPLSLAKNLYLNGQLVSELIIPKTVKEISARAFRSYENLTSVVIPVDVLVIREDAFEYCKNLTSVYYEGTPEDWGKVRIGIMNQKLNNATRYYYSENPPALNEQGTAYDGNYWHYGENGEIIVWLYDSLEN